jgi:hypothetical protein
MHCAPRLSSNAFPCYRTTPVAVIWLTVSGKKASWHSIAKGVGVKEISVESIGADGSVWGFVPFSSHEKGARGAIGFLAE